MKKNSASSIALISIQLKLTHNLVSKSLANKSIYEYQTFYFL